MENIRKSSSILWFRLMESCGKYIFECKNVKHARIRVRENLLKCCTDTLAI
jgi:hypothetical protein